MQQLNRDKAELWRLAELGDNGHEDARGRCLELLAAHDVRLAILGSLGPDFPEPDVDDALEE